MATIATNDFDSVVFTRFPDLGHAAMGLRQHGALIAILAALLVLGTVAILLAPLLIERAIRTELSRRGVDFAEFAISMPGFGGVTARNIRIGADSDFAADSLSVDYRIRGVIQGQIEQIRLVRPRLRLEVSRQGEVSFGSLDALLRRCCRGEAIRGG